MSGYFSEDQLEILRQESTFNDNIAHGRMETDFSSMDSLVYGGIAAFNGYYANFLAALEPNSAAQASMSDLFALQLAVFATGFLAMSMNAIERIVDSAQVIRENQADLDNLVQQPEYQAYHQKMFPNLYKNLKKG